MAPRLMTGRVAFRFDMKMKDNEIQYRMRHARQNPFSNYYHFS